MTYNVFGGTLNLAQSINLHGIETWPIRKENEVVLQWTEMRMVRWMCGIIVWK